MEMNLLYLFQKVINKHKKEFDVDDPKDLIDHFLKEKKIKSEMNNNELASLYTGKLCN